MSSTAVIIYTEDSYAVKPEDKKLFWESVDNQKNRDFDIYILHYGKDGYGSSGFREGILYNQEFKKMTEEEAKSYLIEKCKGYEQIIDSKFPLPLNQINAE